MVKLNSQSPRVWFDGIALVRIMMGVMLMFHGWQLFETPDMKGFAEVLLKMSVPFPEAMAYTGKLIELIGGFMLILGMFTSLATALLFLTFMFITFFMGEGHFLTDNQPSFLYGMLSLLFFFTGAGRFSVDYIMFLNRKDESKDSNTAMQRRFGQYVSKT